MSEIKFRKGDVVSVKATVRMDFYGKDDDYVYLDVPGHYNGISLKPERVDLVKPALEHGDTVQVPCSIPGDPRPSLTAKVMAVADDMVWVQSENGSFDTVNYRDVVRVDASPSLVHEAVA